MKTKLTTLELHQKNSNNNTDDREAEVEKEFCKIDNFNKAITHLKESIFRNSEENFFEQHTTSKP